MSYQCDVCFQKHEGEPPNKMVITLNGKPFGPNKGNWKLCSQTCVHRAFKECANKVPPAGQL